MLNHNAAASWCYVTKQRFRKNVTLVNLPLHLVEHTLCVTIGCKYGPVAVHTSLEQVESRQLSRFGLCSGDLAMQVESGEESIALEGVRPAVRVLVEQIEQIVALYVLPLHDRLLDRLHHHALQSALDQAQQGGLTNPNIAFNCQIERAHPS